MLKDSKPKPRPYHERPKCKPASKRFSVGDLVGNKYYFGIVVGYSLKPPSIDVLVTSAQGLQKVVRFRHDVWLPIGVITRIEDAVG